MNKLIGAILIAVGLLTFFSILIAASFTVMKAEDVYIMWGVVGLVTVAIGGVIWNGGGI